MTQVCHVQLVLLLFLVAGVACFQEAAQSLTQLQTTRIARIFGCRHRVRAWNSPFLARAPPLQQGAGRAKSSRAPLAIRGGMGDSGPAPPTTASRPSVFKFSELDGERSALVSGDARIFSGMDSGRLEIEPLGAGIVLQTAAPGASSCTLQMGSLPSEARILACSRQKIWWMGPWIGSPADGIPTETQFMLVRMPGEEGLHALVLPMVSNSTRTSLQAGKDGKIDIVVETGSGEFGVPPQTDIVYIAVGKNPFALLEEGFERLSERTGTFRTRKHKDIPSSLDNFGWCTWDAFYHEVSGNGIQEGLKSLREGGTPPRFLIIDDGWQDTRSDFEAPPPDVSVPTPTNVVTTGANGAGTAGLLLSGAMRLLKRVDDWFTRLAMRAYDSIKYSPHGTLPIFLFYIASKTVFRRALTRACLPDVAWGKRLVAPTPSPRFAKTLPNRDGFKGFITSLKADYGVEKVFCWHSLLGYWSGLGGNFARELNDGREPDRCVAYPRLSDGILKVEPTLQHWIFVRAGVGLAKSAESLYARMHGYLAECGVDGVKVDSQAAATTLGQGHGGGAHFVRTYVTALEKSVKQNFGEGVINCMCHPTECLYSYKEGAVIRASDDFWPGDTASWTVHIVNVAYNTLFIGEIGQPDWDMFHTKHKAASLHACVRAVGGCSVYVSDKPGQHDFGILKRLVLRDGSTLRAILPGRPTRDSLFAHPAMDGVSALKIWNHNRYCGVVGAFNVQGARWRYDFRQFWVYDWSPPSVKARITPADAELNLPDEGTKEFVIYASHWAADGALKSHSVCKTSLSKGPECTIAPLESFMCTISPVLVNKPQKIEWAPIGLRDMLNTGGAVYSASLEPTGEGALAHAEVIGEGTFLAYAASKPLECALVDRDNRVPLECEWEVLPGGEGGTIAITLPENSEGAFQKRNLVCSFAPQTISGRL